MTRATPNFLICSCQWYIWGSPMCSRSIRSYAFCLDHLESEEGKIHVFPHSSQMIKAIEMNLFPSSQDWECGHFGTLDVENWPVLAILQRFLWFFEKMGLFRGGPLGTFFGRFFFFFGSWGPLTYISDSPESFSPRGGDLKFAKTVPLLVESTYGFFVFINIHIKSVNINFYFLIASISLIYI